MQHTCRPRAARSWVAAHLDRCRLLLPRRFFLLREIHLGLRCGRRRRLGRSTVTRQTRAVHLISNGIARGRELHSEAHLERFGKPRV